MRRVVLVSLDWIRPGDPRTSLGTASICSSLRAAGVDVTVVADAVNCDGFSSQAFCRHVADVVRASGRGTLVGFGAFIWNEPEAHDLLAALAEHGIEEVVFGGPQVSYTAPGELDAIYPGVRYFVRGHGEAAMVDLALGQEENGRNGLYVVGSGDPGTRAEVALEDVPSPHLDGTLPPGAFVRWETQRGCPYRCTFCQHREAGQRLRLAQIGEDRLHAELDAFGDKGVRRIAVLDPIFHAKRDRAVRLLQHAKKAGVTAQLSLQCRFELLKEDFLDAVDGLDVVLEFGLQTTQEAEGRAVERRNHMDRVENSVAMLHRQGVPFEISLIYGLPHQTLDSFRESVSWCLEHRVPVVRAWPLMLLRGTALYAQRRQWGYRESGGRIPTVVASNTFSEAEHAEMARLARWVGDHPGARRLPSNVVC